MLKRNLKINNKIYSKKIVKQAVSDFVDNWFDLKIEKDEIVFVWEIEKEINEIIWEFWNYLVYLEVESD